MVFIGFDRDPSVDKADNCVLRLARALTDFEAEPPGGDLYSDYVYNYTLSFEQIDAVSLAESVRMNWHHTITVSLAYYVLVRLGQWLMDDRRPYDLRTALFLWNAGLALGSGLGFVRFSEGYWRDYRAFGAVYALCRTCNPHSVGAFWSVAFVVSKVVEFGDTIFLVLRKRPLIFLHYYHHMVTFVYAAHSLAGRSAPSQAFFMMNTFVHTLMYGYYAVSAVGYRPPRWMAVCLTSLQIAQMFGGLAVNLAAYWLVVHANVPCHQNRANIYIGLLIYSSFAVLFIQYFLGAYVWPSTAGRRRRQQILVDKKTK